MAQAVPATLYDAAFEHDSCGFGLVAQIDGRASAWVVDTAFDALAKLSHRGGVNAPWGGSPREANGTRRNAPATRRTKVRSIEWSPIDQGGSNSPAPYGEDDREASLV